MDHDGDRLTLMSSEDTCHIVINYCGEHKGNDGVETSSLLPPQQSSNELNVFWGKRKMQFVAQERRVMEVGRASAFKGGVCIMQVYFA